MSGGVSRGHLQVAHEPRKGGTRNLARTIASPLGQPAQLLENRDSMYRHIARQHPVWPVPRFSYPPRLRHVSLGTALSRIAGGVLVLRSIWFDSTLTRHSKRSTQACSSGKRRQRILQRGQDSRHDHTRRSALKRRRARFCNPRPGLISRIGNGSRRRCVCIDPQFRQQWTVADEG